MRLHQIITEATMRLERDRFEHLITPAVRALDKAAREAGLSMELDGTLHDYFDGVEDLRNGVARFVGNADARMQEDYLRILRYFRFQGRLDNPQWDQETMGAIARNAGGLEAISGERIWMEMEKILAQPRTRAEVLKLMDDTDVLEAIDMPVNRISFVDRVDGTDPVAALAAAINTVGGLEALQNKWKFSNEVYNKARFIIENRERDFNENELKVMLADPKVRNEHVFALLNSVGRGEMANSLLAWQPPVFPLSGSDLIAAGMRPGPDMGRQLAALRREWEQSGFRLNRNQLLKMV